MLHCQELFYRVKRPISILSGDDALTVPMMSLGATGVISVTSNVYPKELSDMVKDALTGRVSEAGKKHVKLFAVHRAMFSEASPSPVKAALQLKGRMNVQASGCRSWRRQSSVVLGSVQPWPSTRRREARAAWRFWAHGSCDHAPCARRA